MAIDKKLWEEITGSDDFKGLDENTRKIFSRIFESIQQDMNIESGGTYKPENINDVISEVVAKIKSGNTEYTVKGSNPEQLQGIVNKLTGNNSVAEPKKINYGEGNKTIRDYATLFYGDKANDHIEGIAGAILGKDKKYEKGSDIGSYRFNTQSTGYNEDLGKYLAMHTEGLDASQIQNLEHNSSNIQQAFDDKTKLITRHNNINSELDTLAKTDDYKLLNSQKVSDLYSKVFTEKQGGDLSDDELKLYQDVVEAEKRMKDSIEGISSRNGYKSVDDIFNDPDGFGSKEGKNQTAYSVTRKNSGFLDYEVKDGKLVKAEQNSIKKDYLKSVESNTDYATIKGDFKYSGTAMEYLEEFKDARINDSNLDRLIKLKKSGVDIGNEGDRVLQGYAYAQNSKLDSTNKIVTDLSLAAKQQAEKYDNISDENLTYLKEGGLQLEYADGKFGISQKSIDLMTDDEKKKYQKLIDSNDVGKENLSEISGALDRRYRENKVLENVIQQETKYETTSTDSINLNSSAYYGNNNDMNTTLSYRANTLEEKFGTQENNYNDAFNNFYEKNKDKTIEELSSINTSYNAEGINDPITSIEIGSKTESYIPEINDFQDYYEKNKDIPLNRLNEKISDGVNIDKSDVINNYGTGNLRYNYDIPRDANQKMNVGSEYLNSSNYTSTKIEAESVSYNINHGKINSFEDIRKGASSNYDRITKSYASEDYDGYSLSNDEVLSKSGVTNENIRKEILGAEKFDDLSPEAMGALYGANTKLSQRDINLGNFKELSEQEIKSIEKMNPELGKKLRDISAGDKAQILGRTQEEVSKYLGLDKDGLTSKLEMKRNASLDINDPKVARKVLEDLSNKNPEEALADLIDFTGSRKGYGDFNGGKANKVLDAFRAGTLEKDLRSGRLEQAYGIVRDTIDEIKSIHGKDFAKEYDQFDAKTENMKDKFSVENMKKQAKNFTKEDYDRIDSAFDKGLEATAKRVKNLSGPLTKKSGNLGKAFDFFGSGKGKVALGVAGGMAAIFGVASIAGNAAEERERKRQEMNQLIAAQNANIRSGY